MRPLSRVTQFVHTSLELHVQLPLRMCKGAALMYVKREIGEERNKGTRSNWDQGAEKEREATNYEADKPLPLILNFTSGPGAPVTTWTLNVFRSKFRLIDLAVDRSRDCMSKLLS